MSDLANLLYTNQELDLLRRLAGQEVVRVEAEDHLFTEIICLSGFGISAEPEEVWVSSRSFDDVGYSWVKRAKLSEKAYDAHQEVTPESDLASGIATDIVVLRCAILFSEAPPNEPFASGDEKLDALVESLGQKYRSKTFHTTVVNPELLFKSGENPRFSLVDIGFMLKIGGRLVSVATFDNAFSLDPPVFPLERLDAAFFQAHACLLLSSCPS